MSVYIEVQQFHMSVNYASLKKCEKVDCAMNCLSRSTLHNLLTHAKERTTMPSTVSDWVTGDVLKQHTLVIYLWQFVEVHPFLLSKTSLNGIY